MHGFAGRQFVIKGGCAVVVRVSTNFDVVHVLVDCSKLWEARRRLRSKVGDAFNSIATMLGLEGDGKGKVRQAMVASIAEL